MHRLHCAGICGLRGCTVEGEREENKLENLIEVLEMEKRTKE
jgi:hypothetical protein